MMHLRLALALLALGAGQAPAGQVCPVRNMLTPPPGAFEVRLLSASVSTASFPGEWQEGHIWDDTLSYRLFVTGAGSVGADRKMRDGRVDFTCDLAARECHYDVSHGASDRAVSAAKAIANCLIANPPRPRPKPPSTELEPADQAAGTTSGPIDQTKGLSSAAPAAIAPPPGPVSPEAIARLPKPKTPDANPGSARPAAPAQPAAPLTRPAPLPPDPLPAGTRTAPAKLPSPAGLRPSALDAQPSSGPSKTQGAAATASPPGADAFGKAPASPPSLAAKPGALRESAPPKTRRPFAPSIAPLATARPDVGPGDLPPMRDRDTALAGVSSQSAPTSPSGQIPLSSAPAPALRLQAPQAPLASSPRSGTFNTHTVTADPAPAPDTLLPANPSSPSLPAPPAPSLTSLPLPPRMLILLLPVSAPPVPGCWMDQLPPEPAAQKLQRILLIAGHDPGPIDGKAGPQTQAALRALLGPTADATAPDAAILALTDRLCTTQVVAR